MMDRHIHRLNSHNRHNVLILKKSILAGDVVECFSRGPGFDPSISKTGPGAKYSVIAILER